MVSRPATSSSVPAALGQPSLKVADDGGSPSGVTTFSPGQSNSVPRSVRKVLIAPIWAIEKTTMMRM